MGDREKLINENEYLPSAVESPQHRKPAVVYDLVDIPPRLELPRRVDTFPEGWNVVGPSAAGTACTPRERKFNEPLPPSESRRSRIMSHSEIYGIIRKTMKKISSVAAATVCRARVRSPSTWFPDTRRRLRSKSLPSFELHSTIAEPGTIPRHPQLVLDPEPADTNLIHSTDPLPDHFQLPDSLAMKTRSTESPDLIINENDSPTFSDDYSDSLSATELAVYRVTDKSQFRLSDYDRADNFSWSQQLPAGELSSRLSPDHALSLQKSPHHETLDLNSTDGHLALVESSLSELLLPLIPKNSVCRSAPTTPFHPSPYPPPSHPSP